VPGFEPSTPATALSGLLFTGAYLARLQSENRQKTETLEQLVNKLADEIRRRQALEDRLRASRDDLARRLNAHVAKLTNLNDLVISGNKYDRVESLIDLTLKRIASVMGCESLVFLERDENQCLQIRYVVSDDESRFSGLLGVPLSFDWLPLGLPLVLDGTGDSPEDVPAPLRSSRERPAIYQWVISQGRPFGVLAIFVNPATAQSEFDVALFNTLVNGLELVLEAERARQLARAAAVTEERQRLARDLHDSVTQSLYSLQHFAQTLPLVRDDPVSQQQILDGLEASTKQIMREMRVLLYELRFRPPGDASLVELLRDRFEAVEKRLGVSTDIQVEPETSWPPEWDMQIFLIAIEAVNNALKHAKASQVSIRLSGSGASFRLEITDNGQGLRSGAAAQGGMGLQGMVERCEEIGAHFEIQSNPQTGTTVRISVPPAASPAETAKRPRIHE